MDVWILHRIRIRFVNRNCFNATLFRLMLMEYDACFVSMTGEHEYDNSLICKCCGFDLQVEVDWVEKEKERTKV